jgi:hypothetical protein
MFFFTFLQLVILRVSMINRKGSASGRQRKQKMKEEEKDDDDEDEERLQERAFAEIFDLVSAYSRERCEYEEKTREAMMSIASARYSMGRLGWEAVANEVVAAAAAAADAVGDDDDDEEDESEEKIKRKPPKMIPVHARRVTEKFRELTKASAEVLSLKNNLERKVERYERRYLRDRAATTLQTGNA